MAMTAWSAKVLRSAICFSVKGRTSVRRIRMAPTGHPLGVTALLAQSGYRTLGDRASYQGTRSQRSTAAVIDMYRLPVYHRSARATSQFDRRSSFRSGPELAIEP